MSTKVLLPPDTGNPMKNPLGQRIAFAVAIRCYAAAVVSAFAALTRTSGISRLFAPAFGMLAQPPFRKGKETFVGGNYGTKTKLAS